MCQGILKNLSLLVALLLCSAVASGQAVERSPVAPSDERIKTALNQVHSLFKDLKEGANADYIPELAKVDPELFGVTVATVDGKVFGVGDDEFEFSIQSISKVFTLALVMEEKGPEEILEKLGVEPTGMPFNSVFAVEFQPTHVGNPLVNAGAIATTSLVSGSDGNEKWNKILDFYSRAAGSELRVLDDVYQSEAATNTRNQALARLLQSYGKMYDDPSTAVDIYTKQCSVGVNAKQLAVMGATLASGGINPLTGDRVVDEENIPEILAVMLMAGMYDYSGTWAYLTGLPAKSGVGGGIVAVVPGKGAIAAFSPRLDAAGNSIRAQKAIALLSREADLNIFNPESVGVD